MMVGKSGLRQRPTYNELIEEIQLDEKIKLPNRQAKFLRESPYLSFLDGESYMEMQQQQENAQKHVQTQHVIIEQASRGSDSASEIRTQTQMQNASTQIERMLSSSGTQTDQQPEDMDTSTYGGSPPPPPPPGGGGGGGGGGGVCRAVQPPLVYVCVRP